MCYVKVTYALFPNFLTCMESKYKYVSNLPPPTPMCFWVIHFISTMSWDGFIFLQWKKFAKKTQDPSKCVYFDFVASIISSTCNLSLQTSIAPPYMNLVICMHLNECIDNIAKHIGWTFIHSNPMENEHLRHSYTRDPQDIGSSHCCIRNVYAEFLYEQDNIIIYFCVVWHMSKFIHKMNIWTKYLGKLMSSPFYEIILKFFALKLLTWSPWPYLATTQTCCSTLC
jgi:hypothetical protein